MAGRGKCGQLVPPEWEKEFDMIPATREKTSWGEDGLQTRRKGTRKEETGREDGVFLGGNLVEGCERA